MAARVRIYAPYDGVDQVGYRYNGSGSYTYEYPAGESTPCIDEDEVSASSVQVRAILEDGWEISRWVINKDGTVSYSTSSAPSISLDGVTNLYVRLEVEEIQTYTISATVNFRAEGGQVSPSSRTGYAYDQETDWGYVDIVFPTPTREGYAFTGWKLDGYTTIYQPGTHSIYATAEGEEYIARAQWERVQGTGFLLDDGDNWINAVPYIDNGTSFVKYTSQLDHDGSWESA